MGIEKQSNTQAKARPDAQWPDLPEDVNDKAAMKQWYYLLRTVMDTELDKLADAINEPKT